MNFDNATTDTTATEQAFSVDATAPKTSTAPKKKAKASASKKTLANAARRKETEAQKQRAADKKARDEAKAPGRKPTKKTAANAVVATDFGAADETPTAAALAAPEIPNPLAGAGAESTTMLKAAAKKTRAPKTPTGEPRQHTTTSARAELDALWNDDALPRTGPLTVRDLAEAYILFLESGGQTTLSTISSYKNDLKTAVAFFGENTLVSRVGRGWRAEFDESKVVNFLKSGEPKAKPTILKMRRTFRMAVEWARANETTAYAVAP